MADLRAQLLDALQKTLCGNPEWTYRQLADAVLSLLEEETHWGPVSVPEYHEDGSPVMDEGSSRGMVFATPVHKHHFEWGNRRRWVSPWERVGEWETSEQLDARLAARRVHD